MDFQYFNLSNQLFHFNLQSLCCPHSDLTTDHRRVQDEGLSAHQAASAAQWGIDWRPLQTELLFFDQYETSQIMIRGIDLRP